VSRGRDLWLTGSQRTRRRANGGSQRSKRYDHAQTRESRAPEALCHNATSFGGGELSVLRDDNRRTRDFRSARVLREFVLGGRSYVNWLPYPRTEDRAKVYLVPPENRGCRPIGPRKCLLMIIFVIAGFWC
jgi:hypothetical protein